MHNNFKTTYKMNNDLIQVVNKKSGEIYYCKGMTYAALVIGCQISQVKQMMMKIGSCKYDNDWELKMIDGSNIKWKYINTGLPYEE